MQPPRRPPRPPIPRRRLWPSGRPRKRSPSLDGLRKNQRRPPPGVSPEPSTAAVTCCTESRCGVNGAEATGNPAPHPGRHPDMGPLGGHLPGPSRPHPGQWDSRGQLPRKTSRFLTSWPQSGALGGLPKSGRRSPPSSGTASFQSGCQPGTPLTVSARPGQCRCGRGPGGRGGAERSLECGPGESAGVRGVSTCQ